MNKAMPNNILIGQYRNVFSTPNGKEVLMYMMYELGVFDEASTEEETVLKNYGNRLLNILSGSEINDNTMKVFLHNLMKQPLLKETLDD